MDWFKPAVLALVVVLIVLLGIILLTPVDCGTFTKHEVETGRAPAKCYPK